MVDIFKNNICNYCKNIDCKKQIYIINGKGIITYKCDEYVKNSRKIIRYEKPLIVTAKRDYVNLKEL